MKKNLYKIISVTDRDGNKKEDALNNMKKYLIEDMTSGYSFEMEMSDETYDAIETIKSNLGYVMEDVSIEELKE